MPHPAQSRCFTPGPSLLRSSFTFFDLPCLFYSTAGPAAPVFALLFVLASPFVSRYPVRTKPATAFYFAPARFYELLCAFLSGLPLTTNPPETNTLPAGGDVGLAATRSSHILDKSGSRLARACPRSRHCHPDPLYPTLVHFSAARTRTTRLHRLHLVQYLPSPLAGSRHLSPIHRPVGPIATWRTYLYGIQIPRPWLRSQCACRTSLLHFFAQAAQLLLTATQNSRLLTSI